MTTPQGDIQAMIARGEVDAALALVKQRLADARAHHDDAAVAVALLDEARAQWAKGDRDDAVITVDEAIGTARRTFGPRDARVAEAFEVGAEVAAASDMPNSAEARFAAALDIFTATRIDGTPRAHVLYHYGLFRRDEGDMDGAARAWLAAIEALRAVTDAQGQALIPTVLTELGFVALTQAREREARDLGDEALERWVALGQARRFEVADALALVGLAALRLGEPAPAERFLAMACEVYGRCRVDVRARHARAETGYAEALAAQGRHDEASAAYERALALYREGAPERMAIEERLLELARATT